MMKRVPLLLLLTFLAALPALAAEGPVAAPAPTATVPAAAPATATSGSVVTPLLPNSSSSEIRFVAVCLFPECPVDADGNCSCEWFLCNGNYICALPW
jgi:hypothetical protein